MGNGDTLRLVASEGRTDAWDFTENLKAFEG